MTDPTDEPALDAAPSGASRRTFLTRVAAGGAVLAAGTQLVPLTRLTPFAGAQDDGEGEGEGGGDDDGTELTPDETRVAFLASIALACTEAYRVATDPTTSPLPEPVLEVVRTFGLHHSGQGAGLNGLLPTAVEEANATLVAELEGTLAGLDDPTGMLEALADLEESVAATHFDALGDIEDQFDAGVVASALPVVAQHVTVLRGLAGADIADLVPESQGADGALTPASYPVDAPDGAEPPSTTVPSEGPETQEGGSGPESDSGGDPPDAGSSGDAGDGTESSGGGGTDGGGPAAPQG